ncbi:hypothetical protein HY486_02185 [Candidatus Woesearchaeota archaeon]|nr:hypothetical protein [Candidatus Woesearchaeota archaeon]
MRIAHNVVVTVFSKKEENEEEITRALLNLFPFSAQNYLEKQKTTGVNEEQIMILTVKINKESHTNNFLKLLFQSLGKEDKEILFEQKESRLDDELAFFIRLSKLKMLQSKYELTETGNCYHIKIQLATYPKSRQTALKIIDKLLA